MEKEESFEICPVTEELPNCSYTVIPAWIDNESRFEILLDGVSLGILRKGDNDNLIESWEWIESNLDSNVAEAIGTAIDRYYS